MKKALFYLAQWAWGIIQNLIGLILFLCLVSRRHSDLRLIQHEYGHTVQSLILGPIWPFVIGLPSLI